MAVSPRIVKRRIKSVRSTGKIMKAMELVAASKMRKAIQFALSSRPYAKLIRELTDELRASLRQSNHPLLRGPERSPEAPLRTLVVVIASDRGLCGGFNSQLLRKTAEFFKGRPEDTLRIVTVGHRAERGVRRVDKEIVASFPSIANTVGFAAAQPILRYVLQEYQTGKVDRVFVLYTDFKSAMTQIPTAIQLLPVMPETELQSQERAYHDDDEEDEGIRAEKTAMEEADVLFEPSPTIVLEELLPRLVETRLYQTLLESAASEQSARMMAMRSAGDAAREMVRDLTLVLNQARQAAITREISEISAGKAAIE